MPIKPVANSQPNAEGDQTTEPSSTPHEIARPETEVSKIAATVRQMPSLRPYRHIDRFPLPSEEFSSASLTRILDSVDRMQVQKKHRQREVRKAFGKQMRGALEIYYKALAERECLDAIDNKLRERNLEMKSDSRAGKISRLCFPNAHHGRSKLIAKALRKAHRLKMAASDFEKIAAHSDRMISAFVSIGDDELFVAKCLVTRVEC